MVYMENDACPEKKDFLGRIEDSQGIYHTRANMSKLKGESTNFTHAKCQVLIRKKNELD